MKNGIARLDACLDKLRELNPGVTVEGFKSDFSPDSVSCIARQFNCVIATEIPLSLRIRINNELRRFDRPVPFISADAFGILAGVFCDFGDDFLVHDPRTEEGRELLASNITQVNLRSFCMPLLNESFCIGMVGNYAFLSVSRKRPSELLHASVGTRELEVVQRIHLYYHMNLRHSSDNQIVEYYF